jgi:hypothetical protein
VPFYHPKFDPSWDIGKQLDYAVNTYASGGSTPEARRLSYYGTGKPPPGHPSPDEYNRQVAARMGQSPVLPHVRAEQQDMPMEQYAPQQDQTIAMLEAALADLQAPQKPQGFFETLTSNPFWHTGAATLAAPGYGGNWAQALAMGMRVGGQDYLAQQKANLLLDEARRSNYGKMAQLSASIQQRRANDLLANTMAANNPIAGAAIRAGYGDEVIRSALAGQDSLIGKLDATKFTPESMREYARTRDPGVLVPASGVDQSALLGRADKLRDDFRQDERAMQTALEYGRRGEAAVSKGVDKMTGADDLSLVFSFMKLLDPTSVVREGEQVTAANASGLWPSWLIAQVNYVTGGGTLSGKARQELFAALQSQTAVVKARAQKLREHYGNMARTYGVDPNLIYMTEDSGAPFAAAGGTSADAPLTPAERAELDELERWKAGAQR